MCDVSRASVLIVFPVSPDPRSCAVAKAKSENTNNATAISAVMVVVSGFMIVSRRVCLHLVPASTGEMNIRHATLFQYFKQPFNERETSYPQK